MQTATSHVLNIPELLELILLHLSQQSPPSLPPSEDPRSKQTHTYSTRLLTLLLSQRISSSFHDTIHSSHPLQQALYLQQQFPTTASWTASLGTQPALNPIPQVAFQWRFSHLPVDGSGRYQAYMVLDRADVEEWWCRRQGSWRRMLLSQPPCTDVAAVVWDRASEEGGVEEGSVRGPVVYAFERIKDERGITLGFLVEKVREMFEEDSLVRQIKVCSV